MKNNSTLRLALAGILVAVAVVGSLLSFPVLGSKCAPVQHMVNVFCAILLGPGYGVGVAFLASLLRNLLGLGSLMAFPGSMCGALLSGLVYRYTKKVIPTAVGEIIGTGIIGGLLAYPIAISFMGVSAANVAFYAYIVPFLISTVVGSVIAAVVALALKRSGALNSLTAHLGQ
ncbi:MAG: energy coupling factor transporter S component ThiW [Clostridia bacterium]|nr:energy coupling factor transporter S component ThiW [Clostridia bacterium]